MQSPELIYTGHRDYLMMGYISSFLSNIFQEANYSWLTKDLAKKFHHEINFLTEVDNSRATNFYFEQDQDLLVLHLIKLVSSTLHSFEYT